MNMNHWITWLKETVKQHKKETLAIAAIISIVILVVSVLLGTNKDNLTLHGHDGNQQVVQETQEPVLGETEETINPEVAGNQAEGETNTQNTGETSATEIPSTTHIPENTVAPNSQVEEAVTTPGTTTPPGLQQQTVKPEQTTPEKVPSQNNNTVTNPNQEATKVPAVTQTPVPVVTPAPVPEKQPIGSITLSVDAEVIGLGTLVRNVEVKIYEGEPASYAVTRGLTQQGFTYTNTGNLDKKFYLASIKKSGLVKNVSIPANVMSILEDHDVELDLSNYKSNQLGEFHFTMYSGWRYSVNGTYAGVGMADYSVKPGDKIHLRYTLCLGYDS